MAITSIEKKDAVCIVVSTDAAANEKAYWTTIKSGAGQAPLYIFGQSETVRQLDKDNKYIADWIEDPYFLINAGIKAIYIHAESTAPCIVTTIDLEIP